MAPRLGTVGEWPKLSAGEIARVAPLNKNGRPDMYNQLPTRFVSMEEAIAREWAHFYVGDVCSYGHKAPRFVSNPRSCVDCRRLREGKLTIGGKGEAEYVQRKQATYKQPDPKDESGNKLTIVNQLEPDPIEKRFLKTYAETRDFAGAAEKIGKTASEFQARLSYSRVFREAVEKLETDCGLTHTASIIEEFEWNDDKRAALLRVWVNTGNLAIAVQAVGATNWAYEMELQRNPDFAAKVSEIEPLALRVLDREIIGKALAGDSRLLQRAAEAHLPDQYGQKMNVNMNVTEKLSDEQINVRLFQLLDRLNIRPGDVIDAELFESEPAGALAAPGGAGDEGETDRPEPYINLL